MRNHTTTVELVSPTFPPTRVRQHKQNALNFPSYHIYLWTFEAFQMEARLYLFVPLGRGGGFRRFGCNFLPGSLYVSNPTVL